MDTVNLYTSQDIKILKDAADTLNRENDRIQEIIEYAKYAGLKTIGIANCTTFNKEAEKLKDILTGEGFIVALVNCKYGHIAFNDLIPGYKGISCNPAGQAKYLEEKNTELNIMLGLCLGHDMIFYSKSKAPVTTLIVKDKKMNHYTLKKLTDKSSRI